MARRTPARAAEMRRGAGGPICSRRTEEDSDEDQLGGPRRRRLRRDECGQAPAFARGGQPAGSAGGARAGGRGARQGEGGRRRRAAPDAQARGKHPLAPVRVRKLPPLRGGGRVQRTQREQEGPRERWPRGVAECWSELGEASSPPSGQNSGPRRAPGAGSPRTPQKMRTEPTWAARARAQGVRRRLSQRPSVPTCGRPWARRGGEASPCKRVAPLELLGHGDDRGGDVGAVGIRYEDGERAQPCGWGRESVAA